MSAPPRSVVIVLRADARHELMATSLPPTTLYAALTRGDIPSLELYFSQSDVRASIDATEARVASSADDETLALQYGELKPWFFLPWTHENRWGRMTVLDLLVLSRRYIAVEWLFAAPRDAYMGATLTMLLRHCVVTIVKANNVEILEYALSSRAWSRIGGSEMQSALNGMLQCLQKGAHSAAIRVLVAHGADLNGGFMSLAYDESITKSQVDALHAGGFIWVGSDLLIDRTHRTRRVHFDRNTQTALDLIRLGVDCGKTSGHVLHQAAIAGDHLMVKLLLEEGCVNVDACNEAHQTALMLAALSRSKTRALIVTQLLLAAGADATRHDDQGRTALDHAILRFDFQDVAEILQAYATSTGV